MPTSPRSGNRRCRRAVKTIRRRESYQAYRSKLDPECGVVVVAPLFLGARPAAAAAWMSRTAASPCCLAVSIAFLATLMERALDVEAPEMMESIAVEVPIHSSSTTQPLGHSGGAEKSIYRTPLDSIGRPV